LSLWSLVVTKIIVVIFLLVLILGRLSKVKDGLVSLEVPHDDFAILGGTGQNVGNCRIPADRGYPRTLVIVGDTWFEDIGALDIMLDVLDEHL